MAYLDLSLAAASGPAPVQFHTPDEPGFSALEWSVIALARRDPPSSLRSPGRVSVAMGAVFGERPNPRLADPRLEALRRTAVLAWHHGYAVTGSELRRFYDSGFTARHYELLIDSIAADRARQTGGNA